MAKVADLTSIIMEEKDKITMDGQIEACEEVIAEIKTEVSGYWARIEAMELMLKGLRKIIKGKS